MEVSLILSTALSWSLSLFARCLNSAPLYHQVGCCQLRPVFSKEFSITGSNCVKALHWMGLHTETCGGGQKLVPTGAYLTTQFFQPTCTLWVRRSTCLISEEVIIVTRALITAHVLTQMIFDEWAYLMTPTDMLMTVDIWLLYISDDSNWRAYESWCVMTGTTVMSTPLTHCIVTLQEGILIKLSPVLNTVIVVLSHV